MPATATQLSLVHDTQSGERYEAPTHVELHLASNSTLPKRYGKKIKAAGGRYDACRGHSSTRYVTLPIEGNEALINTLCHDYGFQKQTTIIMRGGTTGRFQSWVVVHHAAKGDDMLRVAQASYDRALQGAVKRGVLHGVTQEQIDARQEEIKAESRVMDLERVKRTRDSLVTQLTALGLNATAAEIGRVCALLEVE